MSALYPQNWEAYANVFHIFLRLLGLFLIVPGFSDRAVPIIVKISLAFVMSLALYPILRTVLPAQTYAWDSLLSSVIRETTIGLLMGSVAYLTFEGIKLGAQFVGYQMGFGTVGLIDPQNQASVSPLVPIQGWLALMIFLSTDLHYGVLENFVDSFFATRQALEALFTGDSILKVATALTGRLFILAVQMAAPFTLLMLACNIAMGVLARTIPQMNVLLFSFPITILLGLISLYILAPGVLEWIEGYLGEITGEIASVLRVI